ncbi:MAG: FecR domain-containing protein [Deltaproteobacteria bacterium]|nr:FecR domain-containing protein [Deltaproteobacteria bacterium]
MTRLPLPVKRTLGEPVDAEMVDRVWERIAGRDAPRAPRGRALVLAGAVGAAVAVAVVLLLPRLRVPGAGATDPVRLADGRPLTAVALAPDAPGPLTLHVDDGSHLQLTPGTELEPLENTGGQVRVALRRGRLAAEIRHVATRRWIVDAGLARVEVVGTRFAVERDARRVRVEVEHGVVLVRSDRMESGARRVGAGGMVQVTDVPSTQPAQPAELAHPASLPAAVAVAPRVATSVPSPASQPERPERRAAAAPAGPLWRALVRRGAYEEAYHSLGVEGLRAATRAAESTEELLALADIARMSGHPSAAVAPLEAAVRRSPRDGRGALAAFTLGRLHLDNLREPRRAAEALLRAITIGLPPALEEDAWVRLVEARVRAGDPAGARISARTYERRFPQGRHRAEVRRWLEGR